MYHQAYKVKCKLTGDNATELLRVADLIRNAYAPHVKQSQILQSGGGGVHLFIEIYQTKEGSR